MEKYQFNMLVWLNFTDREAKTASGWYQGAGWYYNPTDEKGEKLKAQLVAKSEPASFFSGILEALQEFGAEGWSVAAFIPAPPAPPEGILSKMMPGFMMPGFRDFTPVGPYFILQRRVVT